MSAAEKKQKKRELAESLIDNSPVEEQEQVKFELAVRLYFLNRDELLPNAVNNVHSLKPELAQILEQSARNRVARLERIIKLYLNGEPICDINVLGDPPEAR